MTEIIPCPLCGSKRHEQVYSSIQHLEDPIGAVEVCLVICEDCGFMYQNPQLTASCLDRHYRCHSSGAVYREKGQGSRSERLIRERRRFIEGYLRAPTGTIIDVGGGQGDLLSGLHLPLWDKYLLDPSPSVHTTGQDDAVRVLNIAINEYSLDMRHDALLCISTLEHLKDPARMVRKFGSMLKPEGMLFLEVPDTLRPQEQVAEFFSFEHVSHFTRHTLTNVLKMNGFCPVKFDPGVSLPNLRVAARKEQHCSFMTEDDTEQLRHTIRSYSRKRSAFLSGLQERLEPKLHEIRSKNRKIAVYGTGDHTKFLLETFPLRNLISCYIDSDPRKQGTSFFDKPIYGPEAIDGLDVQAILISSHDFEEEIFQAIRRHVSRDVTILRCYGE